jgi:hypothetical protein
MYVLNLAVRGKDGTRDLVFPVKRMVNAGYVGRDQEAVEKHINELKLKGISAPDEVPTLYPVASYLLTTGGILEVVEEQTSGEAEFVVLLREGQIYIGVGSDHTDRKLEADSIIKAKQMCPNVISPVVWLYEEIKPVWDDLEMKSWVVKEGKRILYQETKLSAILNVEDLLSFVKSKVGDKNMENIVVYSGTVGTIGGEMISGEGFEVELRNPEINESLWCKYKVEIIDYVK